MLCCEKEIQGDCVLRMKGEFIMKYLKMLIHYIPLASFIIFVVTDGITSIAAALAFIVSAGGLFINEKMKRSKKID